MPYVPGNSYDLFLSYARRESEWVDDFRARLEHRLYDRLGRKVDFWQDTKELLVGENWAKNIQAVIDNADDGYTAEEIAADIYESLPVERARRIIAYARQHAPHPA